MAVLYGNDAFSILVRSTKKCYSNFLKKSILFLENLFQSKSTENVQKFHWSSHKNIPTSQTEGYFENLYYRFLEEPMLFLLAWKSNFSEKVFSSVKTKTYQILP